MKGSLDGGVMITLATGSPIMIAVDATSVYWTDWSSGAPGEGLVMKVPIGGGIPTTLASKQNNPGAIVVDATSVYWANAGSNGPPNGSIMKLTFK